jgi:hypothetical protein
MGIIKYKFIDGQSPELASQIEAEINNLITQHPTLSKGNWLVRYEYHGNDMHISDMQGQFLKGEEIELTKLVHAVIGEYRKSGLLK